MDTTIEVWWAISFEALVEPLSQEILSSTDPCGKFSGNSNISVL